MDWPVDDIYYKPWGLAACSNHCEDGVLYAFNQSAFEAA